MRISYVLGVFIACVELRTRAPIINIIPSASNKVGASPSCTPVRNIPKTSFLGRRGFREEMNTTSRPIKPTRIRNAAKSDEEEYRRATFMTTQLYPQIRTSTIRDRIAAFCEDGRLGISILSISRLLRKSPFPGC